MGFPAIQLRIRPERPESINERVLILSGLNKDIILQAIEIIVKNVKLARDLIFQEIIKTQIFPVKFFCLIISLIKIVKNTAI